MVHWPAKRLSQCERLLSVDSERYKHLHVEADVVIKEHTMRTMSLLALTVGLTVYADGSSSQTGHSDSASSVPGKGTVTYAHEIYKTNPPKKESHWIPEDSEMQRAAWETVLERCRPVEAGTVISDSCHVALTTYFSTQPIWAYGELRYFDSFRGLKLLWVRRINERPFLLAYSRADYAIEKVPLLGDIFDGQVNQRLERFGQVLEDEECENLNRRRSTGIKENLAVRCSAREIYKYATYLDVCATGKQRLEALNAIDELSKERDLTTYDMSVSLTENKIQDFESRTLLLEQLEKGYLHAYWVTEQCNSNRLALVPNPWVSATDQSVQWSTDKNFLRAIRRTHDVALRIAAKGGDAWAIRSFPLSAHNSGEFNEDVREKYPLLIHRHLASYTGSGLSKDLAREERRRHQAKAYLILEDQEGIQVAQKVIDISDLSEEIIYVRGGGELTYPFSE